jgi:hypothetical protein
MVARQLPHHFGVGLCRVGIERADLAARVAFHHGDLSLRANPQGPAHELVFSESSSRFEIDIKVCAESPLVYVDS